MKTGFNFTLGATLPMVKQLIDEKKIDYCELLIDNFLHVSAHEIEAHIACPTGFHIMFSKFIENDKDALCSMAKKINEFTAALNPLYISDHIACFSHNGRQLYHLAEVDYQAEYNQIKDRVNWWQDKLGRQLLLENYPSIMDNGKDAPEFFEQLSKETGCGVLFDISNAVCALKNCGLPLECWESIIQNNDHFHVAGYAHSILEPHIILDTHSTPLSEQTLAFIQQYRHLFDSPNATLTYERDDEISYDAVASDLGRLHQLFNTTPLEAAQ